MEHTTVENRVYGIAAGHKVNVTWVYLSESSTFYEGLPEETKKVMDYDDGTVRSS